MSDDTPTGARSGPGDDDASIQDGVRRVRNHDGVVILEEHLQDGHRHGAYTQRWENGQLREQGRFYRGVRIGLYRWYGESGALLKEEDYGPGIF
jgi:antitoxin component YwqK of YwqJK toxin-antitoxin module